MNVLKPDFRNKYGDEYEYANEEINKQVFVGIIWYLWKSKVYVDMSRPYDTTGPARAWVTRNKKDYDKRSVSVLDCNVLTQYGWCVVDQYKI